MCVVLCSATLFSYDERQCSQGRGVQDVRRGGRQHQGDVPAHGQVGGAQQGHGASLQVGLSLLL